MAIKPLIPIPLIEDYDEDRKHLLSLSQQLEKLKCVVNTKALTTHQIPPYIAVISGKYPLHWCLKHLGWVLESGAAQRHIYARAGGLWPITVVWRGSNFITMGRRD